MNGLRTFFSVFLAIILAVTTLWLPVNGSEYSTSTSISSGATETVQVIEPDRKPEIVTTFKAPQPIKLCDVPSSLVSLFEEQGVTVNNNSRAALYSPKDKDSSEPSILCVTNRTNGIIESNYLLLIGDNDVIRQAIANPTTLDGETLDWDGITVILRVYYEYEYAENGRGP